HLRRHLQLRPIEGDTMRLRHFLIACGLVLTSTLVMTAASDQKVAEDQPPHGASDCSDEPCGAVARGLHAFIDRSLHGIDSNGRSCADCHMVTDQFQLSPASVELRFQLREFIRNFNPRFDDPLFRPIDADDFRTNGDTANDFSNLRQNGLVRIVFALPSNIRLIDPATNQPSTESFVDVWRMVPSVNDVALTGPDGANPWPRGPNNGGGYQLDGRMTTLQEQARGALINHAQAQN